MSDLPLPSGSASDGADTLVGDPYGSAAKDDLGSQPLDETLAPDADRLRTAPRGGTGSNPPLVGPGTLIGRFVVVGTLGSGGMGVVYAAYDPDLDRRVALKVVRPDAGGTPAREEEARSRLLREAQALARLTHPCVVSVHDVGEHEGNVWLAMEFVDGETLTQWARRPRHWTDVLSTMIAAGTGVEAAHRAGVLHRDLKPDNIMVSADGRVRVMDFGLTRAHGVAEPWVAPKHRGSAATQTVSRGRNSVFQSRDQTGDAVDPLGNLTVPSQLEAPRRLIGSTPLMTSSSLELTHVGALLGTPAYMSPEQFSGTETGPATDTWSYCVTFWEVVFGQRPFAGRTLSALAAAVLEGRREPPPRRVRVPSWLRRALERGLEVEAAARWSSMGELLRELERGPRRWRRYASMGLVALTCGAGAVALVTRHRQRAAASSQCELLASRLDDAWAQASRDQITAAFISSGAPLPVESAERVIAGVDRLVTGWRETTEDTCVAYAIEGTLASSSYSRARWCLDKHEVELSAMIDALKVADKSAVYGAAPAIAATTSATACGDLELLEDERAPPADLQRGAILELTAELELARSLTGAARSQEARDLLLGMAEASHEISWPPLEAARLELLSEAYGQLAEVKAEEEAARDAYFHAAQAGEWGAAADAANRLIFAVGYTQARFEEGREWSRHTELALARAPDALGLREAERLSALGSIASLDGSYEEAFKLGRSALQLREAALGADHPQVATSLNNIGIVEQMLGDYQGGRLTLERALKIRSEAFGEMHPMTAHSYYSLGLLMRDTGDNAAALRLLTRALEIGEATQGRTHTARASVLNVMGGIFATGEVDDQRKALLYFREAAQIYSDALGPDALDTSIPLANLAGVEADLGMIDKALADIDRALNITRTALGENHRDVAVTLSIRGSIRREAGDIAGARADFLESIQIRESLLGASHPELSIVLEQLADLELEARDFKAAERYAKRCIAIDAGMGANASAPPGTCQTTLDSARSKQTEGRSQDGGAGRG